jgi:hypothetical protein
LQIAALVLVVGSFLMAARSYRQNPEAGTRDSTNPELVALNHEFLAFKANYEASQAGQVAFVKALTKNDPGGIDAALAQLDKTERVDDESDALRTELKSLLDRARQDVKDLQPPRKITPDSEAAKQKLVDEFQEWQTRYINWYWTEGKKFGMKRPEPSPAPTK